MCCYRSMPRLFLMWLRTAPLSMCGVMELCSRISKMFSLASVSQILLWRTGAAYFSNTAQKQKVILYIFTYYNVQVPP